MNELYDIAQIFIPSNIITSLATRFLPRLPHHEQSFECSVRLGQKEGGIIIWQDHVTSIALIGKCPRCI